MALLNCLCNLLACMLVDFCWNFVVIFMRKTKLAYSEFGTYESLEVVSMKITLTKNSHTFWCSIAKKRNLFRKQKNKIGRFYTFLSCFDFSSVNFLLSGIVACKLRILRQQRKQFKNRWNTVEMCIDTGCEMCFGYFFFNCTSKWKTHAHSAVFTIKLKL